MEVLGRYLKLSSLPKLGQTRLRKQDVRVIPASLRRVHAVDRRFEPAVIAQLVAEYEAVDPTTVLMARYNLGKGTVLKLLTGHGVQLRGQGVKNIDITLAVQQYLDGWSLKRLGETYGCNAETVRKALKAAGVTMRRPNQRGI